MWKYNYIYDSGCLTHFGIDGQKWGVMHGPPYPLSYEAHTAKQKKENPKSVIGNYSVKQSKSSKKNSNKDSKNSTKEPVKDSTKISTNKSEKKREGSKSNDKKDSIFKRQEERYYKDFLEAGMSKEEARTAAENRVRTDKIIAGTAAVLLTAAAGYCVYRYVKNNSGCVIKTNELLQRVDTTDSLYDKFYASFGEHDNARYAGLLPAHYARNQGVESVHKITLEAVKDIKAPSRKETINAFTEFIKNNPDFVDSTYTVPELPGMNLPAFGPESKRLLKSGDPKQIAKVYDEFNQGLVVFNRNGAADKFYDVLKEKGYNALVDVNDQQYSGFNAKKPLIIFDKSSVTIRDVESIAVKDAASAHDEQLAKAAIEQLGDAALTNPLVIGATGAVGAKVAIRYGLAESADKKK